MNEENNYEEIKNACFSKMAKISEEAKRANEKMRSLLAEAEKQIQVIAEQTDKTFQERIQEIENSNNLFLSRMAECYNAFLSSN